MPSVGQLLTEPPAAARGDAPAAPPAPRRAGGEDRRSRRFRWGGLRGRLLTWFLLLALIPLIGSNTLGYLRSTAIIEDLVQQHLDGIAEVQALHVRDQVERHRFSLQAVTAGNAFLAAGALVLRDEDGGPMGRVVDLQSLQDHLGRKLEELASFEQLLLLAPDGEVLAEASSTPGSPALLPSDPSATVVLRPRAAPDRPPRIYLAVPVHAARDLPVAYLAGTIRMGSPGDFLDLPAHVGGSIESFVVDEEGMPLFVSHPHGHVDYAMQLGSPLLWMPPGSSARYVNGEGVEVIGTSVEITGSPWRLLTEAPVEDALGELQHLRGLSLFLEIFFGALVAVLAWLVARGIVAPVRRLVTATREVGHGNLEVRVAAAGRDEIGELGRAFNEMTDDLATISRRAAELHQREIARAHQLATVGELASGVAHEIKNPVVGISNGLDLVVKHVRDDAKLYPIASEMKRQLSRIETAVRDLLAFARPATPEPAPVPPATVLSRATRLVEPAAEQAGVKIRTKVASDLSRVWMDEELTRQALVNLLMNAVQASAPGGVVEAAVAPVDGGVEYAVTDSGRGIATEDLEKIFRPFYTTRHSGTGLGLSITREIVERQGGGVRVRSRAGEGSTFRIFLPGGRAPVVGDGSGKRDKGGADGETSGTPDEEER